MNLISTLDSLDIHTVATEQAFGTHNLNNDKDDNTFRWCGYEWECCMEGGRIIHEDYPWYWMSKNMVVKVYEAVDGEVNIMLALSMKDEINNVECWNGNTYSPLKACGTIRSVQPFSFGTFSADIVLPQGYNLWPSFWLSGDGNWPPEIDIMEAWIYENRPFRLLTPQFPYINPGWKTTTNVHYLDDNKVKSACGSRNISIFKQCKNPCKNFVNYKVDWRPDSITFYVNDKVVRRIGSEVSEDLIKNLNKPEKGYLMDVIFNVWCEDPSKYNVEMISPMLIKNFKYTPMEE